MMPPTDWLGLAVTLCDPRCPDCRERPGYHLPGCPSDDSDAACVLLHDEPDVIQREVTEGGGEVKWHYRAPAARTLPAELLPCDEAPPQSNED